MRFDFLGRTVPVVVLTSCLPMTFRFETISLYRNQTITSSTPMPVRHVEDVDVCVRVCVCVCSVEHPFLFIFLNPNKTKTSSDDI